MVLARSFNLYLVSILIACVNYAEGALPALPHPQTHVTKAQRDQDITLFRHWWYKCDTSPDIETATRIRAWSDAHPDDGEALFFVWAAYRFGLVGELPDAKQ
jgi:hypothetical protein